MKLSLLCQIGLACIISALPDDKAPTASFHTRPDLFPPSIQQSFVDLKRVSDEYIFVCPFGNQNPGPYIYDNVGNLVWSGAADFGPRIVHGLHVCTYRGEDHLCFFQGDHRQGFAHGQGIIMNRHYEVVKTIQPPLPADNHEFRLMNQGKTALMTSYQPRPFDMTPFNPAFSTIGMGWIMDCVFYELDVETGRLLFQWRASDHVNPWHSYVNPGINPGTGGGVTLERPWDFFHLNSIDKNNEGDYLISSRHLCTIYKISGKDGTIIWSLNGQNEQHGPNRRNEHPEFKIEDFSFCYQHEARWRAENSTHTILSLFDNAAIGENATYPESRGLLISIDHNTGIVNLLASFGAPNEGVEQIAGGSDDGSDGGVSSMSQGNMQLLPNGNWFITFGDHPFFAEYSSTGQPLSWSKLALWGSGIYNYRGYKFSWIGEPKSPPVLWTFSSIGKPAIRQSSSTRSASAWSSSEESTSEELASERSTPGRSTSERTSESIKQDELGGMTFHVSWNGATEVQSWRFYMSADAQGPWRSIATVPKAGFETSFTISAVWKYSIAEALDSKGRPLKLSQIVTTMVPPPHVRKSCDNVACKWIHDENIADLEDLELKDVSGILHESEMQASSIKSHDHMFTDIGFPHQGRGSASIWLPSRAIARHLATDDELPLQMDGSQTFCSEIDSCREQESRTVLEYPAAASLPNLPSSRWLKLFIVLAVVFIVINGYRRRRSFRNRLNEKNLLS